MKVQVINLSNKELPKYETTGAAGLDIRVDLSRLKVGDSLKSFGNAEIIWQSTGKPIVCIPPMSRILLPTGLFTAIPEGYQVSFRPRSGMAIKKGLQLANTPSTIDADYRGEWMLPVINLGQEDIYIEDGERVCQALLEKVNKIEWEEVESLNKTNRNGGFGSTGTL
jgi:dUTP pyrophosphatase